MPNRRPLYMALVILIAVGVILLAISAQRPTSGVEAAPADSSLAEGPFGWIVCGIPTLLNVGLIVWISIGFWKSRNSIRKHQLDQFPDLPTGVPETGIPIATVLEEHGFIRIGTYSMTLVNDDRPIPIPVYAGFDNKVIAMILATRRSQVATLSLETFYTNGALLKTWYPFGETVQHPDHEESVQNSSVEQALEHHSNRMRELEIQHGSVSGVKNVADHGAWLSIFSKRHNSVRTLFFQAIGWLLPSLPLLILMTVALNTQVFSRMISVTVFLVSGLLLIVWLAFSESRRTFGIPRSSDGSKH